MAHRWPAPVVRTHCSSPEARLTSLTMHPNTTIYRVRWFLVFLLVLIVSYCLEYIPQSLLIVLIVLYGFAKHSAVYYKYGMYVASVPQNKNWLHWSRSLLCAHSSRKSFPSPFLPSILAPRYCTSRQINTPSPRTHLRPPRLRVRDTIRCSSFFLLYITHHLLSRY